MSKYQAYRSNGRPVEGEITVFHGDDFVAGHGVCPMCGVEVRGLVHLRDREGKAIAMSMEDQQRIMVGRMNDRHNSKCRAVKILDYDGRFNLLKRNPNTGRWEMPEDEAKHIRVEDLDA